MIRKIVSLIMLTTLATGVSINAEPPPSADRAPSKKVKKDDKQKPPRQVIPAPLQAEGWSYVKGEWSHPDGYKYVKGRVVRTGAGTHKSPPKPPSQALLNSLKTRPSPTPEPNSAAAKAAEKERNMRPEPAPQTGTHL